MSTAYVASATTRASDRRLAAALIAQVETPRLLQSPPTRDSQSDQFVTVELKEGATMWSGFNPEQQKALAMVKLMTALRQQVPEKEWSLVVVGDTVLVVREWPTGEITACRHSAGAASADGTSPSNR